MKLSTLLSVSALTVNAGLTSDKKNEKENRNLSERLGTSIPDGTYDECSIQLSPVVEIFRN